MNNSKKNKFQSPQKSFKGKCAYMLMMIRQKDPMLWMNCKKFYSELSEEQCKDFYLGLVQIYKGKIDLEQVIAEINEKDAS